LGRVKEAISQFEKAIELKPNYSDALENFRTFCLQCKFLIHKYHELYGGASHKRPIANQHSIKNIIQNSIGAYIIGDFQLSRYYLSNYPGENEDFFKLPEKDKVFCRAYFSFLSKLLKISDHFKETKSKKIYHLGESHCLSYAHRSLLINEYHFSIEPLITFGAKAYHFGSGAPNSFSEITRLNFETIPKNSKVFVSFGEIDCRANEGILSAAEKLQKPSTELAKVTAYNFVEWFSAINSNKQNKLFFFNVPAPVFKKRFSNTENNKVKDIIPMYNQFLAEAVQYHGHHLIDVYSHTKSPSGFSNNNFHIDEVHLGPKFITKLQNIVI